MTGRVTVHKLDAEGVEVWQYTGRFLSQTPQAWILEATFGRELAQVGELTMVRGDRFVETFYPDRWYNVFAVYDGEKGRLKGWYCNLARPARLEGSHLVQEDLGLDLVVYPDRRMEIHDQTEYESLGLSPAERSSVEAGLRELKSMALAGEGPFAVIDDRSDR